MSTLSRDLRGHRWPTMRSLLIVRRGYLVLNKYLDDATPQQLQSLQSATTTVTGLLVGIAVREGKLRPADGVPPLFPEYTDLIGPGSFKERDAGGPSARPCTPGSAFYEEDGGVHSVAAGADEIQRGLAPLHLLGGRPRTSPPGERWNYSSGDAIALGGVLRAVTGEPANEYARRTLFTPLGITDYTWITGQPNGLPQMGGRALARRGAGHGAPRVSAATPGTVGRRTDRDAGVGVASMEERRSIGVVKLAGLLARASGGCSGSCPPYPAPGITMSWRPRESGAVGHCRAEPRPRGRCHRRRRVGRGPSRALQLLYDVILPATR